MAEMSLWDRFKIWVTPESYAESLVNQIYDNPTATLQPDPLYDVKDLSSPNVYIQAKGAVSSVGGYAMKAIYTLAGFLLIAIVLYAVLPALILRK